MEEGAAETVEGGVLRSLGGRAGEAAGRRRALREARFGASGLPYASMRQRMSAYVSIRQHTSAYVRGKRFCASGQQDPCAV